MRFQIPFIVSFIVLQWAPSSVAYVAEPDVLNARQRELRKMLIPSGRPPSYEWIATNHMERFGVSLREFTHDLRSIAENEQEERRIRAHAFSQYSRFATDAEILELPYYFDERLNKDLRQSFINRALAGIDSLENRLSFAKRLVSAEERSAVLSGDQFRIAGFFAGLLSYSDPDSPSPEASSQQNRWVVIGFVALAAIVGIMATWRQRNFRTRKKTSKVS